MLESFDLSTLKTATQIVKENQSAVNYIKDYSKNFNILSEFYDIALKEASVDLISNKKVAITEAGKHTIVVNVEDYIANEIMNYR